MSPTRELNYLTALVLLGAAVVSTAAPVPKGPPAVQLGAPVEITLKDVCISHATLLADNESLVVVGSIPNPDELALPNKEPAAGAIINIKTKAIRPFTNGHTFGIRSVAGSAGGSLIATGASGTDPNIRLWDRKAAKALDPIDLAALVVGDDSTFDIAFFPRSNKVAVTLDNSIGVFDPKGRAARFDLTADEIKRTAAYHLTVSPDEKYLACSTGKKYVVIWEVATNKVLHTADFVPEGEVYHNWHIVGITFTKSGKELLVARHGPEGDVPEGTPEEKVPAAKRGLFLIDVAKKKLIPLGIGGLHHTFHFALHPSEEWIATVGPALSDKPVPDVPGATVGEMRVYHYPTRSLSQKVQFDFDGFYPLWVGFTPDGKKLVATGSGGKVMAWDFVPVKK